MTRSNVQELIDSLTHDEFDSVAEAFLGDKTEEELEHYGVLGMRWGVRKDRRTGKKVGKPVAGTKAASRETPSVSPKTSGSSTTEKPKERGLKKNSIASSTSGPVRTTASGETSIPSKNKKGGRVTTKLDQKQKSKLGSEGLSLSDMTVEQLKSTTERMKLEKEISKMLDGPDKHEAMQVVVNRIKLEQEYKRLTAKPPSFKRKLAQKTGKILMEVAEQQVKVYMNKQVSSWLNGQGVQNKNASSAKKNKDKSSSKDSQPKQKKQKKQKQQKAPKTSQKVDPGNLTLEQLKAFPPPNPKDRRKR